uniref:Uncharacterized protein n=1 Tax=Peronospora matthiolae TaxID=2874970 RepID=A0AAV1VCS6_9STRA
MADVGTEATARTPRDDATERKKALLVFKSNLQSASDDDDEDASDEEDDDVTLVHCRAGATREGDRGVPVEDEEEEEEEDDEALNGRSEDDDLDSSPATEMLGRFEMDEDGDDLAKGTAFSHVHSSGRPVTTSQMKTRVPSETDSASEAAAGTRVLPSSLRNKSLENADNPTTLALKSGASNVGAIIAARRRTTARKECEMCHEPRNGRRALLCVQCKCMYHTSCFRQQFAKTVQGSNRQWRCPDCDPNSIGDSVEEPLAGSLRKQQHVDPAVLKNRGSRVIKAAVTSRSKMDNDGRAAQPDGSLGGATETEVQRLTDLALCGGKNINAAILEQTGEMLHITQALTKAIDTVMCPTWLEHPDGTVAHEAMPDARSGDNSNTGEYRQQQTQVPSPPPPPFLLVPASSSSQTYSADATHVSIKSESNAHVSGSNGHNSVVWNGVASSNVSEKDVLLRRVHDGLASLKQLVEQLQVAGIQFEVDLIRKVRAAPNQDRKSALHSGAKTASGPASRFASGSKGKSGASRLYSSKQIQKLEEWYQRSSRPESSEIHSMYRIINCSDYADPELQPEGISVKQIRIWFDNRRAKERLDYMRLKMKDISTTDMDADSVKKMKAAYIDEAKEVLEARVSRMRENGQGSGQVVDAADLALIANTSDQSMHGNSLNVGLSGAGKANLGMVNASKEGSDSLRLPGSAGSTSLKKRIRIDYVASVRKAIKDARDAGKSDEETKALRTAAIERARERLHVPYKNARTGPSKPLGKEEVSHIKMRMLQLLEEDAPSEEVTDIIELLLSLIIPYTVLIESGIQQQLELILVAHKDNKELVRQTKRLQGEFNFIVDNGDAPNVVAAMAGELSASKKRKEKPRSLLLHMDTESLPGTPGSSPISGPTPSPESRRPRVKFSLAQLVKLEKYFHKEDTPSKKKLDKIAARLNGIASLDPSSDAAQRSIDYKQIRCWFYKRRSANQPPQALSGADLHKIDDTVSSSSCSSDTESDDDNKSEKGSVAKRKAPSGDDKVGVKRCKSESPIQPASFGTPTAKSEDAMVVDSDGETVGGIRTGRVFNMKQLATIIEEYEKNPQPTVARLEELLKVLNRDDHVDEHSAPGTGVTKQQVATWFSDRRAKERLDLFKMTRAGGGQESRGCNNGDGHEREETETRNVSHVGRVYVSEGDAGAGDASS